MMAVGLFAFNFHCFQPEVFQKFCKNVFSSQVRRQCKSLANARLYLSRHYWKEIYTSLSPGTFMTDDWHCVYLKSQKKYNEEKKKLKRLDLGGAGADNVATFDG